MEALFSDSIASYEAWLMFIVLLVFIAIFFFDGITFVKRVLSLFAPAKAVPINTAIPEDTPIEIESPMLEAITKAEIHAHEQEKEKEAAAIEAIQEEANTVEAEVLEHIEEHGVDTELIESLEKKEEIPEESATEELAEVADKIEATETPDTTEEEVSAEDTTNIPEVSTMREGETEGEGTDITPETEILETMVEPSPDETKTPTEEQTGEKEEEPTPKTPEPRTNPHTEELYTITNEVKTLIARGNTIDARALIIQGLALDKDHRELNLILGSLYESERQYTKAEYVYKDLALIYENDIEILEKLANILIVEKRYELAMEIYKKIVGLAGETEGSLYIMSHLSRELEHYDELLQYTKRYQKNWPNNPEILSLMAEAEIALGLRQDAIQTLIKLKNLTPYNAEILETINKLTMEEELANNFGN